MAGEDTLKWTCYACGNVGIANGEDGFYYCLRCGSQAEDIIETGVADEDFVDKGGPGDQGALYSAAHTRQRLASAIKAEPISQYPSQSQSQLWSRLNLFDETPVKKEDESQRFDFSDGVGPTEPADFGPGPEGPGALSYEDYYCEVRMRYVLGLQTMIQSQCEALVKNFKVNRMICGLTGTIWLRFVAKTRVFDDGWADDIFQDSEFEIQGEREGFKPRPEFRAEPHNLHGQRAIMIWYRSLRKKIPLSCSLAVSFLACHIVREAILPTDIVKWSLEGKLPYLAAFLDIEKQIGQPSKACPISSSVMFRPSHTIGVQKLESLAASIADSIGLHLPPVNFYGIASRYLQQLSLPLEMILPQACKIYEWSMPADLWLSLNELRLPTRVCVMSILIVAIRILYNIHGYGAWEKSFQSCNASASKSDQKQRLDPSTSSEGSDDEDDAERGCGSPSPNVCRMDGNSSHLQKSDLDASKLLRDLDARYKDIGETYDFSKDLPSYLQYCNDVVFAGLEPSFEDHEEERITRQLWDFYQKEKGSEPVEAHEVGSNTPLNQKRLREDESRIAKENKKTRDGGSAHNETSHPLNSPQQRVEEGDDSSQSSQGDQSAEPNGQASPEEDKDEAIRRLKLDMEENRFYYVPPRINLKRFDYLHYARKKDQGALTYIAHADYYILLRACARVVQIDIRSMHVGVLSFERRLAWLEKRINQCLHATLPDITCKHCSSMPNPPDDDPIGLSNLSL